jgi:hypothetical protein
VLLQVCDSGRLEVKEVKLGVQGVIDIGLFGLVVGMSENAGPHRNHGKGENVAMNNAQLQLRPEHHASGSVPKTTLALVLGTLLTATVASSAEAQVRVPGFLPSTRAFAFNNSFPAVPHTTLDVAGIPVPIGDASKGLCGGMVFAVRDYFEAGLTRPSQTTPPTSGPLYDYIVSRLYNSFDIPNGTTKYMHLMNPDLPDHETWFSMTFGFPRGRAWITIQEEWPKIKQDLDHGRLSPMALVLVKSHDPFMLGQNHQVLAWGYDLVGNDLTIHIYDPNFANNDNVTVSLNIGNPAATTDMFYSAGEPLYAFFSSAYMASYPFDLEDNMVTREASAAPVYTIVGGAKLWIRSPAELAAYFGGWAAVTVVDDGVMSAIGDVPLDGTIVRETDKPEVKLIEGGKTRWITSPAVLARYGGWGAVNVVPSQSLAAIPVGSPIF